MTNIKVYTLPANAIEDYIFGVLPPVALGFHKTLPNTYHIFKKEMCEWVEKQSPAQWEVEETYSHSIVYKLSDELEVLFLLRWSK